MAGRRSLYGVYGLVLFAMASIACATSNAFAQLDGFSDSLGLKPRSTPKPVFTTTLTPASAKAGDEVTLTVHVKLPKGFYIYSTTGEFEGRTRISTEAVGMEAVDAEFVPDREPKTVFEPLLKVEVQKFHDQITWKKRFKLKPDVDPTAVAASGELSGQYCSEDTDDQPGMCIPIIPPFEFKALLSNAAASETSDAPPADAIRFEYEERPKRGAKNPALLRFKLSPADAKPGQKVQLSITMELDKSWHTFSLTQNGVGEPTLINLTGLNGLKLVGAGFVPDHPHEVEQPLPDTKNEVHYDRVTWTRNLEVAEGVKPGAYGLTGRIAYQTCNNGSCLPLQKVKFQLGDLSAVEEVAEPEEIAPLEKKENANNPPAAPAGNAVKRPQDRGLVGFLLTAIGFGFISLLTPCVFPMVPITVSFFLKQSESEHHRPLLAALVFCGSIVATFTILGVGIAAVFGAAKLNALANNPWLNVAIGTVFVVFALNMLGLFEIRIPSELLTFTSNKEQAGGYLGAVFMALTFTLTSFTCTFAFAGTLLVAAAQGQFYWPIIGMLAFGTAFASPFFILALVPSMLKKLPKSGGWMNAIKVVMGLIEIGAAVKFYSVADMVWNPEPVIFDFVFVMIAWLVLSLTIAMYLLGVFRMSHDVPSQGLSVGRMLLVMAFFGLSCNLAIGLINHERGGGWIMDQIIAFAPPRFESQAILQKGGSTTDLPEPVIAHHGIWFAMDVDKAIAYATKKNQPLLFDFTGVNCINCRLMEEKFPQPQNRSRLDKFVLVSLYADKVPTVSDPMEVKRLLKRNVDLQTEWFGDVTLPSYAVVTPDGKTILSRYFGLEGKEGEFAAFMDEGWAKWEAMKK